MIRSCVTINDERSKIRDMPKVKLTKSEETMLSLALLIATLGQVRMMLEVHKGKTDITIIGFDERCMEIQEWVSTQCLELIQLGDAWD